jgi:hypothetical protein
VLASFAEQPDFSEVSARNLKGAMLMTSAVTKTSSDHELFVFI